MGAVRTYVMAGAALAGGGVIAVGPAVSLPAAHSFSADVRLAAGDGTGEEALIMGGGTVVGGSTLAGTEPTSAFVTDAYDRFIDPAQPFADQPVFPGFTSIGLATPEQDWPVTGVTSLPFNLGVDQSVTDLDTAINQTYAGDELAVLGYSQSSVTATMEMNALDALPADQRPDPTDLHFVLLGDMNNPDGGIYERFSFLSPFTNVSPIAALNQPYFFATPPDTPYPTDIYTIEYDGVADFPQYPIDIPADLNAGMGVVYSHLDYASLTPEQLGTAQLLPGSADLPGGVGATDYYLIPVQHLPLLEPLYESGVGAPLADLLSPDLTYIVNLGYGTGPANVPTPAGLFPNIDPTTVLTNLEADTVEGVNKALGDLTGQAGSGGLSLPDVSNIFATLPNGLADHANVTVLLGSLDTLLPDMSSLVGSLDAFGLDPALFTSFLGL